MQNTGIQYLKYVWNLQSLLESFDMWVFRSLEFLKLFILKFACIPWRDFSTQRETFRFQSQNENDSTTQALNLRVVRLQ